MGAEPRTRLRYTCGASEESLIRSQTELQGPPLNLDAKLPLAMVLAELTLREASAQGDLEYEVRVGSVPTFAEPTMLVAKGMLRVNRRGIPAELEFEQSPFKAPDPKPELEGPVGIVFSDQRFEPDWHMGPTIDFKAGDLRAGSDGPVLLGLDRLIVPLPEDPVGMGAKWNVRESLVEMGIRFELATEYELLGWRPGGAVVRGTFSLGMSRTSSEVLTPEHQAVFERASFAGSAEYTVHFDRLMVASRTVTDVTIQVPTDEAGGQEGELAKVRRHQVLEVEPFGAQGLSAFPAWSTLNVARTRWWPINYCSSLHGERNGPFEPWGAMGARGSCVQGKPEGLWVARLDGVGRLSGEFAEGLASGAWVQQGADGGRLGDYALRAGSGTLVEWWPGGAKRLEAEFRNGKPEGRFATWREDGRPHLLGSFSAGVKRGLWTEYDASGAMLARWRIDPGCRIVDQVPSGTPAQKVGILPGDLVVAVGQSHVETQNDVRSAVEAKGTHPLTLSLERSGRTLKKQVTPAVSEGGRPRIGIRFACRRVEPL